MIRIVLIDDHTLVRAGLRLIIDKQPDMEVVGEAQDGESGITAIRRFAPDVALVDVQMPGVSGVEVTQRVRRSKLPTHVVILTMLAEAPFPRRLLEAGASGYLTKGCPADELVKAIRVVAAGRRYLSAEVAQQLALESTSGSTSPFDELSARELEIAMMLARGRSMPDIAERLKISAKTVATYKYRLYEKLNVDNVVTLSHLAAVHGLVENTARVAASV